METTRTQKIQQIKETYGLKIEMEKLEEIFQDYDQIFSKQESFLRGQNSGLENRIRDNMENGRTRENATDLVVFNQLTKYCDQELISQFKDKHGIRDEIELVREIHNAKIAEMREKWKAAL